MELRTSLSAAMTEPRACAVDEAHAFEVDDNFLRAGLDGLCDRFFQRGGPGHVEAPRRGQHRHAGVGLPCLDLEAHWWQAYSDRAKVGPY